MPEHVPEERGPSTGYAVVKYGIILVIVIVILWFVVQYLLPLITEADENGEELPPPEGAIVLTLDA